MSRVVYLDLFSGAGGDMLLACLFDLGLPLDKLTETLGLMHLPGWSLSVKKVVSRGISGTRVEVNDESGSRPARHPADVRSLIESSGLSERVKSRSLSVFARLARVEAAIHGVGIDKVHFHELSAVDSLIDIVGFVSGLEIMGIEEVYSSPPPLGSGEIETEHGTLPVPAPATLALLAEAGAPTRPHPARAEILTPTAAALLAELAAFSFPSMTLQKIGYGIGSKELEWLNATRAWLGERVESAGIEAPDAVIAVECNIDDSDGEQLGYAMERLLAAGALDVWFTPIQMKKNRPAVLLSLLARPGDAERLSELVLRETPTLGVRLSPPLARRVCGRSVLEVSTPWGTVRVKEKTIGGQTVSVSPEYEDCARIAREKGLSLARVREAAIWAVRGE
jgi:uncharacterized protein (TIGR00299 family) protein